MKVCPQHGPQGMPLGPNCPACGGELLDSLEMLGLRPIDEPPREAIVREKRGFNTEHTEVTEKNQCNGSATAPCPP